MKKIILDIDTGIDDAMALAYAVGTKEAELIGVVGTYGNVYTEQGVQNTLNILEMLGENSIPVFLGAQHSISKKHFERLEISAKIHGENGIGDVEINQAKRIRETQQGIDYIIEAVNKYGTDLIIIATGPMTNLGMVLKQYPEAARKIGQIIIMGGALTVPGNVSPYAEANILQDPEAAKMLFESGAPITMVGLDVTMRSVLKLSDTKRWRKNNSLPGEKYADIVDYYIRVHDDIAPYLSGCPLHDPSAVAAAVHPEFFTMLPLFMTVETEGVSIGRTIGNSNQIKDNSPNVKVCINVEKDKVVADMCRTLEALFSDSK